MEKSKITKKIFSLPFVLGFVAFLCCLAVIAGLDEPHFMPFSTQVVLNNPTSFAVSEDGAALVDNENKRMLIYSDEKTVSKIVETTASASVVDEINEIAISDGYIYAIGSTQYNEGMYLSSESIIKYDLNGNYIATLATRPYGEDEFVNNRTYKVLACDGGNVYVTCADGKTVEVICIGEGEESLGTWELPEQIFTAVYVPKENKLAVIGMSMTGYYVDCESGDIETLTLSKLAEILIDSNGLDPADFDLEDLDEYTCVPTIACDSEGIGIYVVFTNDATGEAQVLTNDGKTIQYFKNSTYSFGLFLFNLVFYIALVMLAIGAAAGLVWLFIKKFKKRARIIVIVIGIIIFTAVFYTLQINTTIEDEFEQTIVTQTKQGSFFVTEMYGDKLSSIQETGIAEFCADPDNQDFLEKIHDDLKTMCDANGADRSCMIFTYLWDGEEQLYTFVDTGNQTLLGQPVNFSDDVKSSLKNDDGNVLMIKNSYEVLLYSYGFIRDSAGNIVGTLCTAATRGNISYVQFNSAVNLSITLIVLFIGIYVLLSSIMRFRTDIKRRRSREKTDFTRQAIDMAGILTFAMSMVSNLDSAIIVYVAESLCIDMDPAMQAILVALPLTAVTAGWLVGTFIADGFIRRVGERSAAIISSVITIAAMLFCMFSIIRGSIWGYTIGKLVQNIFLSGVLYVEINTIPYRTNDEETRRTSLNSIIQHAAAAGIISTLMSGFVAEYLSYSMVYLMGGILTVAVLIISIFVFKNTSDKKEKGRQKEKLSDSGKYWTIFLKKPMLMFILFYIVPTMLVSGYKSYLFPMYSSSAGISALLLSSITILVKALTYVTNDSIRRFTEKRNQKVMLVVPRFILCAGLICFFISPNIYWAIIMLFALDILLNMTSITLKMHVTGISESFGLDAKRVQSNYYTVSSAVNVFQSPILSGIVGLGVNLACSVVGLVAGAMFAVFALFNRKKQT